MYYITLVLVLYCVCMYKCIYPVYLIMTVPPSLSRVILIISLKWIVVFTTKGLVCDKLTNTINKYY